MSNGFVFVVPATLGSRFVGRPASSRVARAARARRPRVVVECVCSDSWRRPRWLSQRVRDSPRGTRAAARSSWRALALLCAAEAWARARAARKRVALLKLCTAAALLWGVSLAWAGYARLNAAPSATLSQLTHASIHRGVAVGRLKRVSLPGNLHFAASALLPAPPDMPDTAPDIACAGVRVSVARIWPALAAGRPLAVSVYLHQPTVHVRQALDQDRLDLGVYGEGPEVIEVRHVDADLHIRDHDDANLLSGVAVGHAHGTALNGGEIDVTATCDLAKVLTVKSGDPIVDLAVAGKGVPAPNVAAFLNMPFRADAGSVDGNLRLTFLHDVDVLVPDIYGKAALRDVSLRFHPDPATPEFSDISGQLRFEDKIMYMDGPSGDLGSLPMTVSGSIDLVGDYNLVGTVRGVDVNDVINTFDVDKFVPVTGRVKGEAKMTGPLEEPYVRGTAVSVGKGSFDRVSVDAAKVDFEWDAIAGVLKFTEVSGDISGGGNVLGKGGMYFDMTKITPYGMNSASHHPNSPKASVWPDGKPKKEALPPPPEDEMDIDVHAPSRPYDSMYFEFSVRNAVGGNLIRWYVRPHGEAARAAIGLVDGDAVIAGHAKDANCRALWRTVSPAREVSIASSNDQSDVGAEAEVESGTEGVRKDFGDREVYFRQQSGPLLQASRMGSRRGLEGSRHEESFPGSKSLGGGDFRGAVFLKLGDLPAARRVKVRTTVTNFDLRRLGWDDEHLKDALANTPNMIFSGDTYFKGVLHQQLLPVEPGKNPRTPEAELLGADGALAVRGLSLNHLQFSENMTGTLSFGKRDMRMTLDHREVKTKNRDVRDAKGSGTSGKTRPEKGEGGRGSSSRPGVRRDAESRERPKQDRGSSRRLRKDHLRVSGSLDGKASLSVRCDNSEVVFSCSDDDVGKVKASFLVRDFPVEYLLGGNGRGTDGIPCGSVSADGVVNVTDKVGDGSCNVKDGILGGLFVDRLGSILQWRNEAVYFHRTVARIAESDYHVEGSYSLATKASDSEPAFEARVVLPNAEIQNILAMIEQTHGRGLRAEGRELNSTRIALRPRSADDRHRGSMEDQAGYAAFNEDDRSWSMPDMDLQSQVAWFKAFVENEKERARRAQLVGEMSDESAARRRASVSDLQGRVRGTVVLRYGRTSEVTRSTKLQKSKLPQFMLGPMSKSYVQFNVECDDLMFGTQSIGEVKAEGGFSGGGLRVDSLSVQGQSGFEAFAKAAIGANGSLSGYAYVKDANAATVGRHLRGKFRLEGDVNARVDLAGVLSDPVVDGRAVWTKASLNGQTIRDAQGDLQCRDGRCSLDVNARLGGRRSGRGSGGNVFDVHESLLEQRARNEESKNSSGRDGEKGSVTFLSRGRLSGEPLMFSVSAPVRFYVLEHLRRTAPSGIMGELEPLLSHSDDSSISMDVNVRKYGGLLLNAMFPDAGWIDGRSDIALKVRGTLDDPSISGRASVVDGQLWPADLSKPIDNIKGEVSFEDSGAVSFKSVFARFNGRPISISGTLPLSAKHTQRLQMIAGKETPKGRSISRASRKALLDSKAAAASRLDRFSRGIVCEVGDVLVDVKDHFYGRTSGRLVVKNSLLTPRVAGSISISHGAIYLASPPISPEAVLSALPSVIPQARPDTTKRESEPDFPSQDKLAGKARSPARRDAAQSLPSVGAGQDRRSFPGLESPVAVSMDELKISLGRDLRVVYPYLMNFGVTGEVSLSGSTSDPSPTGTIRLNEGEVNLVASKMEIRRGGESYVRFEPGGDPLDPILSLELEYRDLVLHLREARASKWLDHLSIADRRGEEFDEGAWLDVVRDHLEEVQKGFAGGLGIPNLAAKYFLNSYSLKGKLGGSQWRFYPAVVSATTQIAPVELKRFARSELMEDIGIGADFEYGKVGLSGRCSLSGLSSGKLTISPSEHVKVVLETDGRMSSAELEVLLSSRFKQPRKPKNLAEAKKGLSTAQSSATESETQGDHRTPAKRPTD